MPIVRRFCGLFLIGALLSLPALGQRRVGVEEADFFDKSDLVFVGELVDQESDWDDDHRLILTRHVFRVEDSIKGEPGGLVEITEYGGVVGNIEMNLSHSTRYAVGREYLVFSYQDAERRNRTLHGPLGQFQILSDRSGERVVRMYPTHPLAAFLGDGAVIFRQLEAFSSSLREALASRSFSRD